MPITPSSRRALLNWFGIHRRDLPWRADRDPYRIWISEVMLQQTTVAAVVPYFHRFIERFPTLQDLAQAEESEVLRSWEGLGYYRRARHLHAAAKHLFENHPDEIPDDPKVWADLPGVGRYILGAVLSQAFERRLPILEANTKRVLARLFAIPGALSQKATLDQLWFHAAEILPRTRIGDFNQAMMELGALVCTVQQPKCPECPLKRGCRAFREGITHEIPAVSARREIEQVHEVAVIVRRGTRFLLCQRPDEGRWSRMWEFPHIALRGQESVRTGGRRLLKSLGLVGDLGQEIASINHTVTHHRISMTALAASFREGPFLSQFYVDHQWLALGDLSSYPLSVPQRKFARILIDIGEAPWKSNSSKPGKSTTESISTS